MNKMNSNLKVNERSILNDFNLTKEDLETIKNFNLDLVNNQIDLDPEYSKIVDDNFWDLI